MNARPKITLEYGEHRNQEVVFIRFAYNESLVARLRDGVPVRWSQSNGCWYTYRHSFNLHNFFEHFRGLAYINYTQLKHKKGFNTIELSPQKPTYILREIKEQLPHKTKEDLISFKKWMQQIRYSENTVNTYIHQLEIFFGFYKVKSVEEIRKEDIVKFNQNFILKNGLSITFQNQTISALKKFYSFHLNSLLVIDDIERPQKGLHLPKVMSRQEIKTFLDTISNLKHKMAFETIYAYGLRRSELLNLKLEHINRQTGLISIINAKGKKDRIIPISKRWLDKLIPYFKEKRPLVYVIEGQFAGKSISAASLQKVFERKLRESKIKRHYTIHSLRHSLATHMLETGVNLRYIQEFLGHKSSKTTEIYTHVSSESLKNIRNPFDDFENI